MQALGAGLWIRKTIRKVTMVVPVLITSCQVSLNLKIGPVAAHPSTIARQAMKVHGLPATLAVAVANLTNSRSIAPQPPLAGEDCTGAGGGRRSCVRCS
ncbi:MAG: hypothetical protein FD125_2733 [bacterium]|nr:MAG: hypothetical protein FD125_2733 [bacterium]